MMITVIVIFIIIIVVIVILFDLEVAPGTGKSACLTTTFLKKYRLKWQKSEVLEEMWRCPGGTKHWKVGVLDDDVSEEVPIEVIAE